MIVKSLKNRFVSINLKSLISIIFIIIAIIYHSTNVKPWKNYNSVVKYDVISYYSYLPAAFIYHDITLSFLDNPDNKIPVRFWPKTAPNGGKVIMTSMGMSIMYAPGFFLAHWLAPKFGYEQTGNTLPYTLSLVFSNLFYLIIGLFFLRKFLLKFYSDLVTAITLLIIVLTTNLFFYSTMEAALSHGYSFSLFCIFIYLVHSWYKNQTFLKSIIIGLIYGLIALIRPTNSIIILIFLLWNTSSLSDLKSRFFFFLKKYKLILVIVGFTILVWIPQMIYWKIVSGQFLYYSYGSEDGKFFFNNPHIFQILLGFRKGWLIYTPIMFFPLLSMFFLRRNFIESHLAISIFLPLNIYLISSWWCWWYGGCFGMRPMIESYAILAIPLATGLTWVFQQKRIIKIFLLCIFFLVALQSAFHNVQYYYSAIHWDAMTKEAYFDSYGRVRPSKQFHSLLKNPDYDKARKGIDATIESK